MSYEIVKELKCIRNTNSKGENFPLTVGKHYCSLASNASINSEFFTVFDDYGNLSSYDAQFFEIVKRGQVLDI